MSIKGYVFDFKQNAVGAARSYACLTGREYVKANDIDQLNAATCNDVIVCMTEAINLQVMHRLFVRRNPEGVPGIICAGNENELERLCCRQASRLAAERKPGRRIFAYSMLNFEKREVGTDVFVGGADLSKNLLPLLSSTPTLLFISTHSNGIDFGLSLHQFACPFLDSPVEGNELSPECQTLGRCTRFPSLPSIADARKAGWIVPLSTLRADIAVMPACNVIRCHDGAIHSDYGLARTLLAQADFGALITTWRAQYGTPDGIFFNGLLNDLSTGMSVGRAVGIFNSSSIAGRFGLRLCVIGDPCFKLFSGQRFNPLPVFSEASENRLENHQWPDTDNNAQAELLIEAINHARGNNRLLDAEKGKVLGSALAQLVSPFAGSYSRTESQVRRDLDSKLLEFLGSGPLLEHFVAPHRIEDIEENGVCPTCSAEVLRCRMVFTTHKAKPWRIVKCPLCGDSILPEDWRVVLDLKEISDKRITVSEVPDNANVLCAIHGSECLYREYMRAGPENSIVVRIPNGLPSSPLRLNIILVRQLEFAFVGFNFRVQSDILIGFPTLFQPGNFI